MASDLFHEGAPEPLVPARERPRAVPPRERLSRWEWVEGNLLRPWHNAVLTVVFGALVAFVVYRLTWFVVVTGRWDIIRVNLTSFMVGRYPRGELHRPWIAIYLIVLAVGIGAGARRRGGARMSAVDLLRRVGPLLALTGVVLSLTRTPLPAVLAAGAAAVAAAGWAVGSRLPPRIVRPLPLAYAVLLLSAYLAFRGVPWDQWGGLLLTIFLAVGGIVLSFPLGVLLALGRRSSFPITRTFCVVYIEAVRGVPLITVLFMAALMLGFLLPPGVGRPDLVTRALVAIVLFSAAYVAEIVRGGLQGVPRTQVEAALALGLSPFRTTLRVVLPQALRNVIPALVGNFISLLKDTSLVVIIGLTELLRVAQTVTRQPDFVGQGLATETLAFAGFVYWALCYAMSRSSQRLEERLGVGRT